MGRGGRLKGKGRKGWQGEAVCKGKRKRAEAERGGSKKKEREEKKGKGFWGGCREIEERETRGISQV